jgi:hypothetical protein
MPPLEPGSNPAQTVMSKVRVGDHVPAMTAVAIPGPDQPGYRAYPL